MMGEETRLYIVLMAVVTPLSSFIAPAAVVLPLIALGMWLGRGIDEMNGR